MKIAALLMALVVTLIGLVGVVTPDLLGAVARNLMTPAGLLAIAAVRVVLGALLIALASSSRTPTALRVIGVVLIVAGVVTPAFGVQRSLDVLEWVVRRSFLRVGAAVVMAAGLFMMWALAGVPSRRGANS